MRRRNAQKLIAAGAVVTIGTDNYWAAAPEFTRGGTKPDAQNHGIGSIIAIEGLVELGMTPAQAIVAATTKRRDRVTRHRRFRHGRERQARRPAGARRQPARRHHESSQALTGDARRPRDRSRLTAGHARPVAMKQPALVPSSRRRAPTAAVRGPCPPMWSPSRPGASCCSAASARSCGRSAWRWMRWCCRWRSVSRKRRPESSSKRCPPSPRSPCSCSCDLST